MKTIPQIARDISVEEYRVRYAAERLGVKPAMKVSDRIRLFDSDAEKQIVAELNAIRSRRAG